MEVMKTVAFYNNKGGVGKTTLTVHLALYASKVCKHTVVAACLDRQGDSYRWLTDGEGVRGEGAHRVNPKLSAIYTPHAAPDIGPAADLVVLDCPPSENIGVMVRPNIWVVPITERLAAENLYNVIEDLRGSDAEIILVLNRRGEGGRRQLQKMIEAVSNVKKTTYYERGIGRADAIVRITNEFSDIWSDPFARKIKEDMTEFCKYILRRCGLRSA